MLKTKGTQRGIRALINCFGIPADILDIKTFVGKTEKSNRAFFGESEFDITQIPGIRLDHTGSLVEGNTLSKLTSIVKTNEKYTQDLHNVEIGFSPSDNIDRVIKDNISIDFNLDHFLGDPRNLNSDSYDGLVDEIKTALSSVTEKYNVKDFIRLIKFFDNVVFKMVKDFLPARSNVDTGVIIKPHLLDRSKYKSVDLSGTRPEYSGSVDTAFISGSSPGVYEAGASGSLRFDSAASKARAKTLAGERGEVSTRHILNYVKTITNNERTNQYRTYRGYFDHGQGESKYDGELKNSQITVSSGELNDENPYKQINYPNINYDVFIFKDLPITICSLTDRDEVIVLGGFDGLEDHYINISPTIFENITGTTKFYENLQFNSSNQPINEVDAIEIGNNQAYPGQLFIEAAAEPPKYVQYQEYTIQAYDSEREGSGIDLAPSCASERTFKVVRCRLRPLPGGASNYFVSLGDIIAPKDYFIGTQVNTEFTIKANGDIVDSEEYEITTNEVLLEAFDNHDPTCTATVTLSVDTCPVTARSTLDVRGVPPNNTVHVPASFQGLPDDPDSDQSEYKFYIGFLKLSSANNFIPMSTSEIQDFLRPPYENRIGDDGFVELYADTVTNQGANGNHIGYRQFPILKVNLMNEMFTSAPGATFDTFGNQQGGNVVAVQFMARKIDDPICSPKTPVRDLNTENYQSIVIQKVTGMRGNQCSTCNVNTINTNINVSPQFDPAEFFEAYAVMIREFSVNDDPPPTDYTNLDDGDLEDLGLVTTISNCARAGIVPYRELNSARIQYNLSINQGFPVEPNGTGTLIPRAYYTNPPVFAVNDTDDVVVYRLKDIGSSFNPTRTWHIQDGDVALSCEGTGPGEGAGIGGENQLQVCWT